MQSDSNPEWRAAFNLVGAIGRVDAAAENVLRVELWDHDFASKVIIPHHETFSATIQPPYSSTKG
jgi:hypothetical protein